MIRHLSLLGAALGLLWAATPVQAGGVYRCVVDGVPTFASKAIKGQSCKAMAHAPPPPSRPHLPSVGAVGATKAPAGIERTGTLPAMPMPTSAPGELPPLPPMSLPPETPRI